MTMSLILVAIFCLLAVDGTEETVVKVVENHIDVSLPTKQTFTSRGAMERKTDIQNTKSNFSLGTTQFTARPRRLRTYDSYSGFEQKYIGPRNDSFPAKRVDGDHCMFNKNCISGCCVKSKKLGRWQRRCAPLTQRGQNCTTSQLKGGLYSKFCPCQTKSVCTKGVCKRQRRRPKHT